MATVSVEVYGLTEIKDYLSKGKVDKTLALGINDAVVQLHSALRYSVATTYKAPASLDSVLVGRSTSSVKQGKNFIESGLQYKFIPIGLDKYLDSYYPGNINPGATKQGRVHVVEIKRGAKRIVYGKEHRGGFVPRKGSLTSPGAVVRLYRGGGVMFERTSQSKFPVKVLFGPSLSQLALTSLKEDKKVQSVLNKLEETIIERFI